MAYKIGQVVAGTPWGYGAADWQKNIGKYYDPRLAGKYYDTEEQLNAALPVTANAGPRPYDPTQPLGPMPLGFGVNPETGKPTDEYNASLEAFNNGADLNWTPGTGKPGDVNYKPPAVTIEDKRKPATDSSGSSLADIMSRIDAMEYQKADYTPYNEVAFGSSWEDRLGALNETNNLAREAAKATLAEQEKKAILAAKDTVSGRGLGRSTIAASYLNKPQEDTTKALSTLENILAQAVTGEKGKFLTEKATWEGGQKSKAAESDYAAKNEQAKAAAEFEKNKLLTKLQIAISDRDFEKQAALQKTLAEMGYNANKEIANMKTDSSSWWEKLLGAVNVGVNFANPLKVG